MVFYQTNVIVNCSFYDLCLNSYIICSLHGQGECLWHFHSQRLHVRRRCVRCQVGQRKRWRSMGAKTGGVFHKLQPGWAYGCCQPGGVVVWEPVPRVSLPRGLWRLPSEQQEAYGKFTKSQHLKCLMVTLFQVLMIWSDGWIGFVLQLNSKEMKHTPNLTLTREQTWDQSLEVQYATSKPSRASSYNMK